MINFLASAQTGQAPSAYTSIIEMIASGELHPGEHLPALELSQRFGMSRTPVIAALKQLENDCIVVFRSGNGAWLANPTAGEVRDLYALRGELETFALKLSAPSIKTTDIIELRKYVALEQEYIKQGDKLNTFRSGLDFHRALFSLCSNKFLVDCLNRNITAIFAFLVLLDRHLGDRELTHPSDHEKLIEHLSDKQYEKAVRFLGRHIEKAYMIDMLAKSGPDKE